MAERPELAELVMRCYVELIDQRAEAGGFKKGDFAQKVWPETTLKNCRARWLHIRTITPNTGQPQGVLIADAYRMAQALGESFSLLMMRAEDMALKKMEEFESSDAGGKKASKKTGQ